MDEPFLPIPQPQPVPYWKTLLDALPFVGSKATSKSRHSIETFEDSGRESNRVSSQYDRASLAKRLRALEAELQEVEEQANAAKRARERIQEKLSHAEEALVIERGVPEQKQTEDPAKQESERRLNVLRNDVKQMEEKLKAAETLNERLEEQVKNVSSSSAGSNNGQLNFLKEKVETQAAEKKNLQQKLSQLQNEITQAKQQNTSNTNKISELQQAIAQIDTQIAQAQSQDVESAPGTHFIDTSS